MQDAKNRQKVLHHCTTLSGYIFATKASIDNRKKNLLSSNTSSTCPDNMVNFGPLAAEIDPVVWGTPANLNGFRVLPALLHGSQVLGISQTLPRWTEGATYIRQGGHHVGHWPTFLACVYFCGYFCWFLWPPNRAGHYILQLWFLMVALCNRADHNIFILWFLSSFLLSFFSSPNLSGRRLDVFHTSTHGVALVRI